MRKITLLIIVITLIGCSKENKPSGNYRPSINYVPLVTNEPLVTNVIKNDSTKLTFIICACNNNGAVYPNEWRRATLDVWNPSHTIDINKSIWGMVTNSSGQQLYSTFPKCDSTFVIIDTSFYVSNDEFGSLTWQSHWDSNCCGGGGWDYCYQSIPLYTDTFRF